MRSTLRAARVCKQIVLHVAVNERSPIEGECLAPRPAGILVLTHAKPYGRSIGIVRRLRNQAQLCTRTLSLAAAVYVVLMLVGRVSSMAHVNFLSQAEAHAGGPAPASAAASAEQSNGEKKPFTAEWDEDDDYHSPPCRSPDSHPYEGRLLGLHRPHLVFVSRVANTNFSRGPPLL